jgi:photosystem II stability/assembly factor-like uncharacterized protein
MVKAPRLLVVVVLGLCFLAEARAQEGGWTNQGLSVGEVRALAADPEDPMTIYASVLSELGIPGGIFKSVDGAHTWIQVDGSSAGILLIDPHVAATVYTGEGGVRRSLDGGESWASVDQGLSCPFVVALAIDPENSATLLAGTAFILHSPPQCGGLFRSVDAGSTWNEISPTLIDGIAIDPRNSLNVLAIQFSPAGAWNLIRSTDGGESWSLPASSPPDPLLVVADPVTANRIYVGSGDGVFVSSDDGETWRGAGLGGLVITAVVIDPADPAVLYAGTQLDGVWRSLDGGESWSAFDVGLTNSFVEALAINATGTRLYAGTRGGGVFEHDLPPARAILVRRPRATRELKPRP